MKRYFCYGLLLIAIPGLFVSCSSLFKNPKIQSPIRVEARKGQAIAAIIQSERDLAEPISKSQPSPFIHFIKENQCALLALVALLAIWLLARAYEVQRGRLHDELSVEDLALLKIIKDNATRIWKHHHSGKKIIRLEDWRE